VHLAIDKFHGLEWAVKFIDIKGSSLGGGVATILKEAEIMKNLQHQHIVNLKDVFADGMYVYCIMYNVLLNDDMPTLNIKSIMKLIMKSTIVSLTLTIINYH
jgi:serine/threonine protein kinase